MVDSGGRTTRSGCCTHETVLILRLVLGISMGPILCNSGRAFRVAAPESLSGFYHVLVVGCSGKQRITIRSEGMEVRAILMHRGSEFGSRPSSPQQSCSQLHAGSQWLANPA